MFFAFLRDWGDEFTVAAVVAHDGVGRFLDGERFGGFAFDCGSDDGEGVGSDVGDFSVFAVSCGFGSVVVFVWSADVGGFLSFDSMAFAYGTV